MRALSSALSLVSALALSLGLACAPMEQLPASESEAESERTILQSVAADTLVGKHLVGYQGWFGCPDDGSQLNTWSHWSPGLSPSPATVDFEAWPDVSDLPEDALCNTDFVFPNGQPAQLFSSNRYSTVERHFTWMAEHGIHGALLQRFSNALHIPQHLSTRDLVADHTRSAAEQQGRIFAVVYDITGTNPTGWVERIEADWRHLVDDLELTESAAYLHEDGLPLVGIWGIGFTDRPGTAAETHELLDFFQADSNSRYAARVLGGVPTHWRSLDRDAKPEPAWTDVYDRLDVLSPWTVGRYRSNQQADQHRSSVQVPDMSWTAARGIHYLPVIFPGFSWANLTGDVDTFNLIPRSGGRFYWRQFYNSVSMGATSVMTAMFDEVDEATAILPIATGTHEVPNTGRFLHLAQDGEVLPADWYLRLAGAASEVLAGARPLTTTIPINVPTPSPPPTPPGEPAPPTEPTPPSPPTPPSEADLAGYRVSLAYQGILGRPADASGLVHYRSELLGGRTVAWLCTTFAQSGEFASNRAQLSSEELATTLYMGILGRSPDPGGLAATITAIENGQMAARAAAMILSEEAAQNFN